MELPASHHWAKLDARHIARFGELTKREIQVICVLFLSRNGSNNRCNPKRKTIGQAAGLDRSAVSRAVAGLESKGWVVEMPDGEFHLFAADEIPETFSTDCENPCGKVEKVVKLTTTEGGEVLSIPQQTVVDSATNRCQIDNSLNKELNRQGTELEQKRARSKRKPAKPKTKATRIPEPFELTDEMIDWAKANTPLISPAESHADFIEYWTNLQTKRAIASNWRLRWEKGFRLMQKWFIRDQRAAGVELIDPDCKTCKGSGTERTNLESFPCSVCLPERNRRYWKTRGR